MVDQSKNSSDSQNQPNFFSETLSIFSVSLTSIFTIYLSLLSLSIFLKFCYFHNVGKKIEGLNLYPNLGIAGIVFFSFSLITPALTAIGGMLGSGKPNYGGSYTIPYLVFVIVRGLWKGHTIPKGLPAFPGLPHILGGIKNWEKASIYPNQNPPKLNPERVIDVNWTSESSIKGFFMGPINSLIVSHFKSELGMKNIGDKCLVDNSQPSCNGYIKGEIDESIFLGNKYVGK